MTWDDNLLMMFQLSFGDTGLTCSLTWREVVDNPSTFTFFAAPMPSTRAFDQVFRNCKSLHTLHHQYLAFYDEFEGDAYACSSLESRYRHHWERILKVLA